jgi:hypothetical protein
MLIHFNELLYVGYAIYFICTSFNQTGIIYLLEHFMKQELVSVRSVTFVTLHIFLYRKFAFAPFVALMCPISLCCGICATTEHDGVVTQMQL